MSGMDSEAKEVKPTSDGRNMYYREALNHVISNPQSLILNLTGLRLAGWRLAKRPTIRRRKARYGGFASRLSWLSRTILFNSLGSAESLGSRTGGFRL